MTWNKKNFSSLLKGFQLSKIISDLRVCLWKCFLGRSILLVRFRPISVKYLLKFSALEYIFNIFFIYHYFCGKFVSVTLFFFCCFFDNLPSFFKFQCFNWSVSYFYINHHSAEISLIWLVQWSAIKLLILHITREKLTLRSREILMLTLDW